MAAGYQNLYLEQGASFDISIALDDVYGNNYDLNNATAKGQIRKSYYSANTTAEFNTTIDVDSATIALSLDSNQTANIAPGRYVYDSIVSFEGIPGTANTVVRILEGVIDVSPSVTR
jgi:uncharacterized membrane protein